MQAAANEHGDYRHKPCCSGVTPRRWNDRPPRSLELNETLFHPQGVLWRIDMSRVPSFEASGRRHA